MFFFVIKSYDGKEREREKTINNNPEESILPNFDFFVFPIFAFKLAHFKLQTIFSYSTKTLA